MDKNAIFNEFKKSQEISSTKEVDVKEETKQQDVASKIVEKENEIIKLPSKIGFNSKNKKRRKNKKNLIKKSNVEEIKEIEDPFEKWKKEFLSDDTNKDFLSLLDFYRENNFHVFTNEVFLKNKYEHPNMRTVVLDPTLMEINAGKGGHCYLIKPLYTDEYNYFLKNVGTRDQKPEEFMKYAVKTGVLYPEFNDEILEKTGAGTILALYNYVLQFSDLTKTIKILEV